MSPLDELDIDRVTDKVRLVVREELDQAMDRHIEEHHRPIEAKVDALQARVWQWSGGLAALGAGVGWILGK